MKIADVLTPTRVCFLTSTNKNEALDELLALLSHSTGMADPDAVAAAIRKREELMSTGIGVGIGVPHVRLSGIKSIVMAIGVSKEGLADYVSLDAEPVRIVAMIVAGAGQHAEYIRLLSQVVEVLKESSARRAVLEADSPEQVFHVLTGE